MTSYSVKKFVISSTIFYTIQYFEMEVTTKFQHVDECVLLTEMEITPRI